MVVSPGRGPRTPVALVIRSGVATFNAFDAVVREESWALAETGRVAGRVAARRIEATGTNVLAAGGRRRMTRSFRCPETLRRMRGSFAVFARISAAKGPPVTTFPQVSGVRCRTSPGRPHAPRSGRRT